MKQILLTIIILCIGTVLFAQNLDNVAILDLEPKGLSTIEAEILSGKLRQATVDSRLFEVVDRGNMDAILEEQSVQLSGCISGECVVQVGQLLGVVKIISGTVGKFGSLYTISLTLTDIESGKIEKQSGYELQGEVEYLLTFGITNAYKKLMGLSYQNPQIIIGNANKTTNTMAAQPAVNGMGSLIIESDPGGAQVTLDGMNMGTTPFRIEQIPSGSKYLQLTLVGYDDHKNYINIQAYQENKITQILKWKDKAEMVFVKGGSFQMGSNNGDLDEKPIHSVIVSDFYISKSEVSQALYQEVMGKNPSHFKGNNRPVENVSWYDAVKFCNELSRRDGLIPSYTIKGTDVICDFSKNGFRLPTEAEWEYAARGGTSFLYSGSNNIEDIAWYSSNSGRKTHDVGTKQVNSLGLYDMSGNVWECCWDWKGSYSSISQTDPTGPSSGSYRVKRGGSWGIDATYCQVDNRGIHTPAFSDSYIGFRTVRSN